jgi:hypothetical protein
MLFQTSHTNYFIYIYVQQLLIDHGADLCDPSLLYTATSNRQSAIAQSLIDHLVAQDEEEATVLCHHLKDGGGRSGGVLREVLWWQSSTSGATSLHVAAQLLDLSSINVLIKAAKMTSPASPASTTSSSDAWLASWLERRTHETAGASATALFLAVKSLPPQVTTTHSTSKDSHRDIDVDDDGLACIRVLLEAGADVNSALPNAQGGYTPLLAAVIKSPERVCEANMK